jgi:hypothetical protein
MGLYYQTEYRLGRRGGKVCRHYRGLTAVLAIAIDLLFVLTFDILFAVLFFAFRMTLKLLTAVFYLLSLPFRLVRWVSNRLERKFTQPAHGSPLKPPWPAYDEV